LSWLTPPRLSLACVVRPDQAGIGAAPARRAKCPSVGEAGRAGGVTDQGRGRDRADPVLGENVRLQHGDRCFELALSSHVLSDAAQLVARDPDSRGLRQLRQSPGDALDPALAVQRPGRELGLQVGVKLDQVPAQPVLMAGALGDEIVAVIGQQPDLERGLVQERHRQLLNALLDRRSGDCDRIDLIRLARRPL
jgi:hypothetical protein